MVTPVFTIPEDTRIEEIAETVLLHNINRIPAIRGRMVRFVGRAHTGNSPGRGEAPPLTMTAVLPVASGTTSSSVRRLYPKGYHRVVLKLYPELPCAFAAIKDRDLREASMHIHSHLSNAIYSHLSMRSAQANATSTDTRSQRRRDSRRGGQITTRACSSKSIRPALFLALRRPCPDRAALP